MKQKIIKTVLFLIIFYLLLFLTFKLLWVVPTPISYLYNEKENSLDVIYLGASNAYAHFNSVLAYKEYGFTTGLMSTDLEPFILTKYLIIEANKTQKPSLYIIDFSGSIDNIDDYSLGNIRKTTDSMKFSKNRTDAINKFLSYREDVEPNEYNNYYYSFLMYHNSWKHISKKNIIGDKTIYKGHLLSEDTCKIQPQQKNEWVSGEERIEDENIQILLDLLDYVNNNNLETLFILPTKYYTEQKQKELNFVMKLLEENHMKYINFNEPEYNNIDYETDFYNIAHLNVYGATKYTLFFSEYLKKNYTLKNHKEDKDYDSWEKEYERYKNSYKNITGNDFNDLLVKYK